MQILINDPMLGSLIDRMREAVKGDVRWIVSEQSDDEELCRLVADVDVYVGFRFTAAMAQAAHSLNFIQVSGAGYDGIALDALPWGVTVANTFNHERSIAEYIFMAMLALSRDLFQSDSHLRQGIWESIHFGSVSKPYRALRGCTIGLIGFGHIGVEVAQLASCFQMHVLALKRRHDLEMAQQYGLEFLGTLEDLPKVLRRSDFVVLALPLTADTRGILGAKELAMLKPSAYLINVARAALVDEQALFTVLKEQRIAGAALDVWYKYPTQKQSSLPANLPFHELENVILTPHNSANTDDTFVRRADDIAANIRRLMRQEPLVNIVHPRSAAQLH